MKKFLINTAVVCGLVLVMFVAVELLLLTQTNVYSYKRQYIENHLNTLEIVFFGNSHIEEAVKPELVGENCFNLAISGRSVVYDVELAKRYIPKMSNLKTVFMPLDYPKFSLGRGVKNEYEKRVREMDFASLYKCMYTKYMDIHVDGIWYWSEILNSELNYMTRFFKSAVRNRECDSLGYIALDVSKRSPNWEYRNMPPIIDVSKPIDTVQFNILKSQYRTFAELTKNAGVRLVLLGTPLYKTYLDDLNPAVLNEIESFVADLQRDFSNVEFFDFTADKDFLPEDFDDASHLMDSGAEKFSKKLKLVVEKN